MDALVGYSSDSDSSQDNGKQPAGALSGLLGSYSDDESKHEGDANAVIEEEPPLKRTKCDAADADKEDVATSDVLPPPQMAGIGDASPNCFQSLVMISKDYTVELREKLAQQFNSQIKEPQGEKHQQLSKKLDQMYQTFQSSESKSFATHLKSQHPFHNPHLLKDIINHFEISPLRSNVSNEFGGFEYVDRLMAAEEKSRVAAAGLQPGIN
jgi:hypothetical protein